MTKEELEKEAEEYAKHWIVEEDDYALMQEAYIDGAEPREKRIEELELKIKHLTKHLEPQSMTALFEQVEEEVKQEQRVKELEAQIKEMKGILLCTCEGCSRLSKLYKAFDKEIKEKWQNYTMQIA